MPKLAVTAPVEFEPHRRGLGAGVDRHPGRRRDARADPGQLGIAGDADAVEPTLGPSLLLRRAQARVADRGAGRVEAFDKAGAVPDDPRGGPVRKFRFRHQVAAAQLDGIEAELPGGHVDQPLGDEGGNRPPDPAIGTHRRLVGRDGPHPAAIDRDAIGAGQKAHDLNRLQRGGPGIDRIGPDIADRLGLERQDAAIGVEPELGLDDLVETVTGRRDVFEPRSGPAHRAAEMARQHGAEDFLRVQRRLAAEPAADLRGDDADARPRHVQQVRKEVADDPRHLRRSRQRDRTPPAVPLGEIGARFHRRRRLAVKPEPAADPYRRFRHRRRSIAAGEFADGQHIRAGLVVQQRRVLRGGGLGVDKRGKRLEVDLDPLGRILGEGAALRQNRGDRLADIADLAAGERVVVGRVVTRHPRGRPHRAGQPLQLGGREDRGHPRHRRGGLGADGCNPGMGLVAAPKGDVQGAGNDPVGGELARAGQQARILHPSDPRPDISRADQRAAGSRHLSSQTVAKSWFDEVAGADLPALDVGMVRHDPVPPDDIRLRAPLRPRLCFSNSHISWRCFAGSGSCSILS